jgi:hypothetical protein
MEIQYFLKKSVLLLKRLYDRACAGLDPIAGIQ